MNYIFQLLSLFFWWPQGPNGFWIFADYVLLYFPFRKFLQVLLKNSKTSMTSIHLKNHLLVVPTVINWQVEQSLTKKHLTAKTINRKVLLDPRRKRIHRTTEHALSVIKCSLDQMVWLFICEFTLEKNHMHALNVTNDLVQKAVWTNIFPLTQERSDIRVNTAATYVQGNMTLPDI